MFNTSLPYLPCKMFVLKNRITPEMSGANCHAKLSHSKQLLKKYSSNDVSTILLTDEKIYTVLTPKNTKNHQLYTPAVTKKKDDATKRPRTRSCVQTVTDDISRQVISGRENTRLILVDHGVNVIVM